MRYIRFFCSVLVWSILTVSVLAQDIEIRQGFVEERRADVKTVEAWNAPSDPYYVLIENSTDSRTVTLRPSDAVGTEDLQAVMGHHVELKGFYTEGEPYQPKNTMESYPIEQQPVEQQPLSDSMDSGKEMTWQPAKRGFGFVVREILSVQPPVHPIPFEDDNGLWGYEQSDGEVMIQPQYHMASDFSAQGLAAVVDESGWTYIDTNGKVVITPFLFDNGPDYFVEGVARFVEGGKMGFFDETGTIVIPAEFDFVFPFSEGLAVFCTGCQPTPMGEHSLIEGGRWGYLNHQGVMVIPAEYENAQDVEDGMARVKMNGEWLTINKPEE